MKTKNLKLKYELILAFILSSFFLISSCIFDPDYLNGVRSTQYSASDTVQYHIPVIFSTQLQIEAISGLVEITGVANLDSVVIWAEKRVESESISDAQIHLEKLSVQINQREDILQVKTIQPGESNGRNYLIYYVVQIPKDWRVTIQQINGEILVNNFNRSVQINNTNGDIRLENINGNVTVNLTNGGISLVDISGNIGANNVNGIIYADITLPASGSCDLNTVNGNIALYIPETTSSQFLAQVVNGTITLSNLLLQDAQYSPTRVAGRIGSGDGQIELHAVNGVISVTGQ